MEGIWPHLTIDGQDGKGQLIFSTGEDMFLHGNRLCRNIRLIG